MDETAAASPPVEEDRDAPEGLALLQPRTARERWEQVTELPMAVLALVFLGAYAWPILDPDLPDGWARACAVAVWVVWVAFVVDYAARLLLSRQRARFVRGHVFDLVITALPILRPLRALLLVQALLYLNRRAGWSLRGRVVTYVVGSTALVILVAALAVLDAERGAEGAGITSFGDAVWWAFVTVTTVGYGDYSPVTGEGRAVAVGLMIAGIALLGVVTATFASWIIDRVSEEDAAQQNATRRDVQHLAGLVEELRTEVRTLRAADRDTSRD